MKIKSVIVVASLLISGLLSVNGGNAQTTGPTNTDNVTLNIKLNPIQTITVNTGKEDVDIVYSSIKDYEIGVSTKSLENHLTVFSTGGFTVNVESGEFLTNSINNKTIDASDVTVLAENASDNTVTNTVEGAVSLGSSKALITSTSGGRSLNYNVTYDNSAGAGDKYIDMFFKDGVDTKGANTYTTEVTYTIVAS